MALRGSHKCSEMIKTGIARCHRWRQRARARRTIRRGVNVSWTHANGNRISDRGTVKQHISNSQPSYSKIINKWLMNKRFLNMCIAGIRDHADRKEDEEFVRLRRNKKGRQQLRVWFAIFLGMNLWNRSTKEFWVNSTQEGLLT